MPHDRSMNMGKTIELTEAQYAALESVARARGRSPNDLLAQLIEGLQEPGDASAYYDTDDWFRHLGVSDDDIEQIKREVREDAETDADTQ